MAAATRERIQTENEKYGMGVLNGDTGGAWIVLGSGFTGGHVANVFDNHQACEDYIYAECEGHPDRTPDEYTIQVWAISKTWPNERG